ncbi:hypothetical protein [Thermanaeromonas sp. C210]|uniref:hypothetical protein n=1 Tax=Thermanaeromonas sp. C210 TaxID=2731925 RepID=UPI00155BEF7D|nr:hypothetical protein [Thermanaeromonas sp. C210]GFN21978.1 hypothetical protein TAMC210_02940 [Thermanaeromonas sp. C210]
MAVKLEENKVKQAVNSLLAMLQSGDLPKKSARTFINARAGYGKPSDNPAALPPMWLGQGK